MMTTLSALNQTATAVSNSHIGITQNPSTSRTEKSDSNEMMQDIEAMLTVEQLEGGSSEMSMGGDSLVDELMSMLEGGEDQSGADRLGMMSPFGGMAGASGGMLGRSGMGLGPAMMGEPFGGGKLSHAGAHAGGHSGPANAFAAGAGKDLQNVKINSTAAGYALHVKEDSRGDLYNSAGNSIGKVEKNGSVELNSGATSEAGILETGAKNGQPGADASHDVSPTIGNGGEVIFSAKQVSVSAGDLNQVNDA